MAVRKTTKKTIVTKTTRKPTVKTPINKIDILDVMNHLDSANLIWVEETEEKLRFVSGHWMETEEGRIDIPEEDRDYNFRLDVIGGNRTYIIPLEVDYLEAKPDGGFIAEIGGQPSHILFSKIVRF